MKTREIVSSILVLLSFCLACNEGAKQTKSAPTSPISNKVEFDLQGHRGARGLYPENSIEGFLAAVELQVNTVEMDVVISKDHKVVVSHEPWFNPTICVGLDEKPVSSDSLISIYSLTYDEVTNYNCGSLPHPHFPLQAKIPTFKPLLSEVIAEVEKRVSELELPPVYYNIEIKSTPNGDATMHPNPKMYAELVLDAITTGAITDRTIIQSFDVRALQATKKLAPNIPLALLVEESAGLEKDLAQLGFNPEIYSPHYKLVTKQLVKACREKNMRVIPWTVNEEEDMVRLLELGVDGIITDYPDVALTLKL